MKCSYGFAHPHVLSPNPPYTHLVRTACWDEDRLVLVLLKVPGLDAARPPGGRHAPQLLQRQHEAVIKHNIAHLSSTRKGAGGSQ